MKEQENALSHDLVATREFYTSKLGFGVTFENDWYLLLHIPGREAELAFLLPNQFPLGRKRRGSAFLTVKTNQVRQLYDHAISQGVSLLTDFTRGRGGKDHFAIQDPNGYRIRFIAA